MGHILEGNFSSTELSRSDAKHILEKQKSYVTKTIKSHDSWQGHKEDLDNLIKLEQAGYVMLTMVPNGVALGVPRYDVTILDKLQPYILTNDGTFAKVIMAEVAIDEISGITKMPMDENSRVVQYTIKTIPTPLIEVLSLYEYEKAPKMKEALFRKYDDGWRLEQF